MNSQLPQGLFAAWQSQTHAYHVPADLDKGIPAQTREINSYIGEGHQRNGILRVWVPGLGSNGRVDRSLLERHRLSGSDVLALEPPGMGFSPGFVNKRGKPLHFSDIENTLNFLTITFRILTSVINKTARDLGSTQVIVEGHSYGAAQCAGLAVC